MEGPSISWTGLGFAGMAGGGGGGGGGGGERGGFGILAFQIWEFKIHIYVLILNSIKACQNL